MTRAPLVALALMLLAAPAAAQRTGGSFGLRSRAWRSGATSRPASRPASRTTWSARPTTTRVRVTTAGTIGSRARRAADHHHRGGGWSWVSTDSTGSGTSNGGEIDPMVSKVCGVIVLVILSAVGLALFMGRRQ